jgi:hypothetical protein
MKTVFEMTNSYGDWVYAKNVPKIINGKLSCSYRNLPIIPPKNAIIVTDEFYCYYNSLFSLDSLPLISQGVCYRFLK